MAEALIGSGKGLFSTSNQGLAFRTRRRATELAVRRQKASLAEHVANGGSVRAWSEANGLSQSRGSQLWRQIVADMGSQAR